MAKDSFIDASELVFATVAAVGVNLSIAEAAIKTRLAEYGYEFEEIKITRDVIPSLIKEASKDFPGGDYDRIVSMMNYGDQARREFSYDVLARGAVHEISQRRKKAKRRKARGAKIAYLIHSLKHPDEVRFLRDMYPKGFHLIGVHAHSDFRKRHLMEIRKISASEADELMDRDKKNSDDWGQQLIDTFHLSDFFVGWGGDDSVHAKQEVFYLDTVPGIESAENYSVSRNRVVESVCRYVDIVFGDPYKTPTFGEHAMFLAFATSLRSADLSRQVGAVIARDGEILSTGANDCPAAGGGLYWPKPRGAFQRIEDSDEGRDYLLKQDSNRAEQEVLVGDLLDRLESALKEKLDTKFEEEFLQELRESFRKSGIGNLTEYGRVVHAEMEALMSCARQGLSPREATIYCTTFPCHNCAKHIIAAGIKRVVFVEPYLKSKALVFHKEAIEIRYPQGMRDGDSFSKVGFEPFFGVGPRRYLDLFSLSLGEGQTIKRKDKVGETIPFVKEGALPRLRMNRVSYIEREKSVSAEYDKIRLGH